MADWKKQSDVSGLTATDPRFEVFLSHRIKKMRGLRDLMALSSAEIARRAHKNASGGMPIDEQVRALNNLKF
jgi:hypothetical protein